MCLKESCFPDCWKVSLVVPVFKNVGERSTAENYSPVSLLSEVNKVFIKLVNNVTVVLILALRIEKDMNCEYIHQHCLNQQFKCKKKSHLTRTITNFVSNSSAIFN